MGDTVPSDLPTRYRVLEQIGSGRSADVYLARDTHTGTEVAIKVIRVNSGSVGSVALEPGAQVRADRALERFETEIRALSRLKDVTGIQNVLQVGLSDRGHPWIASEFLGGGSMSDPGSQMDRAQVGMLFGALAHAHTAGISHGDISPSNLLFSGDGSPVICDFGMARLMDLMLGSAVGGLTPAFAAPERIRGAAPSPASDVYALAASIKKSVAVDARTQAVIDKAMTPDPTKRPSATQVARRLRTRGVFSR